MISTSTPADVAVDSDVTSSVVRLAIVLGIAILSHLIAGVVLSRASRWSQGRLRWGGVVADALRLPVGLLIWLMAATWVIEHAAAFWSSQSPDDAQVAQDVEHLIMTLLPSARIIIACFCGTLFVARILRRSQKMIESTAKASGSEMDLTALQALFGVGVVFVWAIGGIVCMQALGMNMSAVLTIGGIGSAAFAFASKDVIANFFGGIMVLFNRPFRVGDFVLVKGTEGDVEQIGLYATLIRTLDKRIVYIPNSTFVSSVIENMSERTHREFKEVIGLRYDDFDAVESIISDIRSLLEADSDIDHQQVLRVAFGGYGDSTIDVSMWCYTRTSNSGEFARIRQRLMIEVGRIVKQHGADFAYPTMTLDMPQNQVLGTST